MAMIVGIGPGCLHTDSNEENTGVNTCNTFHYCETTSARTARLTDVNKTRWSGIIVKSHEAAAKLVKHKVKLTVKEEILDEMILVRK